MNARISAQDDGCQFGTVEGPMAYGYHSICWSFLSTLLRSRNTYCGLCFVIGDADPIVIEGRSSTEKDKGRRRASHDKIRNGLQ